MNKYPKSTVSAIAWKLPKRNNIRLRVMIIGKQDII